MKECGYCKRACSAIEKEAKSLLKAASRQQLLASAKMAAPSKCLSFRCVSKKKLIKLLDAASGTKGKNDKRIRWQDVWKEVEASSKASLKVTEKAFDMAILQDSHVLIDGIITRPCDIPNGDYALLLQGMQGSTREFAVSVSTDEEGNKGYREKPSKFNVMCYDWRAVYSLMPIDLFTTSSCYVDSNGRHVAPEGFVSKADRDLLVKAFTDWLTLGDATGTFSVDAGSLKRDSYFGIARAVKLMDEGHDVRLVNRSGYLRKDGTDRYVLYNGRTATLIDLDEDQEFKDGLWALVKQANDKGLNKKDCNEH